MNPSRLKTLVKRCIKDITIKDPPLLTIHSIKDLADELAQNKELNVFLPPFSENNMVEYSHIYDNSFFTMGVFILHPNSKICLHDHPSMNVISSLLCGSLKIKSYSIIRKEKGGNCIADMPVDEFVTAPHTSTLEPEKGNIHEFQTTTEGCAILDIIIPPYSKTLLCTYYRVEEVISEKEVKLVPFYPKEVINNSSVDLAYLLEDL